MASQNYPLFTLERYISLEKENSQLVEALDKVTSERNELLKRYSEIFNAYSKMEGFLKRVLENFKKLNSFLIRTATSFHGCQQLSFALESPNEESFYDFSDYEDSSILPKDSMAETEDETEFEALVDQEEMPNMEEIIPPLTRYLNTEQLDAINASLPVEKNANASSASVGTKQGTSGTQTFPNIDGFNNMNLKEDLFRAIYAYDWTKLYDAEESPIILELLKEKDTIVVDPNPPARLSRIATYCIFLLQQVDPTQQYCQALILVPYRELAHKIYTLLESLGSFMNIQTYLCIGGEPAKRQEEEGLSYQTRQIVVGTPGRINDMIARECLPTNFVSYFVMDEAQNLLSDVFVEQTRKVLTELPLLQQIVAFTTRLIPPVADFCDEWLSAEVHTVEVEEDKADLDSISQFYLNLMSHDLKDKMLLDIRKRFPTTRMVIFCNGQNKISSLKNFLRMRKEYALTVHASMKPVVRESIMKEFSSGSASILITTELPLRRFDEYLLENVSMLINYELPTSLQYYYARIAHCGPGFAKNGTVLNFTVDGCRPHVRLLAQVEQHFHTQIKQLVGDPASFPPM